jgi:predicted metal-dependent peptidase
LISLNKVWRNDLPTAGVSISGINQQLAINPEFWASLNDDVKKGVLIHELMHIAFNHLVTRDNYQDKKLFNIAAD